MNGIDGISPAPTPKVGIEFMIGLMLLMLNTAARTKISRKHANPKNRDDVRSISDGNPREIRGLRDVLQESECGGVRRA
ncbi:MAG: hypothetical protein ACJ8J3_17350 [Burkholderia ambifaria]